MLHLLIIWSNASRKKEEIINDLRKSFVVRNIFAFHWDKDVFLQNLKVFYSHSQYALDEKEYHNLFVYKMQHCGSEDFTAVIVEDEHPDLQERETSSGKVVVNANMFDKKQLYREWTGGGHQIHTSNSDWETNKDLTMLFGYNSKDFTEHYEPSEQEIEINRNCVGVGGFDSIEQLFYLLNNSIEYVVMRNHECLPNEYTEELHGDIDLLVEDKNYIKYLTSAKDVYQIHYRVYHTILIDGKEVPFDFRHIGDDYYDVIWQYDILQTRQLNSKGFYVPNAENQYYSLLYHAYIQKPEVAADYPPKLRYYAEQIGIEYKNEASTALSQLDDFLLAHNYDYVRPQDITVHYNRSLLQKSKLFSMYGEPVSKSRNHQIEPCDFFTAVYKRPNSYLKRATDFLIDNEYNRLKQLERYDCFPKVLDYGLAEYGKYIEISEIEGQSLLEFFKLQRHRTPRYLRSFTEQLYDILRILVENSILHRDFIHRNWIIREENGRCKLFLLDFGWAADIDKHRQTYAPTGLGTTMTQSYKLADGYSDFYSAGRLLNHIFPVYIPYIKKIEKFLVTITADHYDSTDRLQQDILQLKTLVNKRFSLNDYRKIFLYRHSKVNKKLTNLKKKIKRRLKR